MQQEIASSERVPMARSEAFSPENLAGVDELQCLGLRHIVRLAIDPTGEALWKEVARS
jgi:hypothetical protein